MILNKNALTILLIIVIAVIVLLIVLSNRQNIHNPVEADHRNLSAQPNPYSKNTFLTKMRGSTLEDNYDCKPEYCANKTSIDTKCIVGDVINQNEAGGASPADPNAAISKTRIVTTVNVAVEIRDRNTMERIYLGTTFQTSDGSSPDFWRIPPIADFPFFSDPIVYFEESTGRFYYFQWESNNFNATGEITIESPEAIAGTYLGNIGDVFESSFNLSGYEIVPAEPLNADTPLTNDLTGKIALIAVDGFATSSRNKGNNAAAAGAVGCIIFYPTETVGGIFGSDFIPSIAVPNSVGQAILDNQPVVGEMKNLQPSEVESFSRFLIAVSKDDSPNGPDDWYQYAVGDKNGPWKQLNADYSKIGVDKDAFYIVSNDFKAIDGDNTKSEIYFHTVAVQKQPLIDGVDNINILLDDIEFVGFQSATRSADSNQADQMRVPSFVKTPSNVTCFVGTIYDDPLTSAAGSKLLVRVLSNVTTTPTFTNHVLHVKPWKGLLSYGIHSQMDGFWQEFGAPTFNLTGPEANICYRCIQDGDSLWCCHSVAVNDTQTEIRWYEIDISHAGDVVSKVYLKQQGSISAGGTTSAFYPSLDIDKCGNLGIAFNIAGPNQPLAIAHTGRLKHDPKGTVRYPLQTNFIAQPEFPYYDYTLGEVFLPDFLLVSRWNDYTSVQVDPRDGRTFMFASQYSNITPEDYIENVPFWKEGYVFWEVSKDKCAHTYSAQKPRIQEYTALKASPKTTYTLSKTKSNTIPVLKRVKNKREELERERLKRTNTRSKPIKGVRM